MAWLTGWSYRKKITISGSSGAGTNYQVLLKVGESSGATGANFHLGGLAAIFPSGENQSGDLRFTSSDGTTLLNFWVEKVVGSSPNRVAWCWVKVSENLDTSKYIYIYFGNPNATNYSNGDNTFIFFDDFNSYTAGQQLPTTKWPYQTAGWKIYQDGNRKVVRYEGGSSVWDARAINNVSVSGDFAVESLMKGNSGKDAGILILNTNDISTNYGYCYSLSWGNNGANAFIYYLAGNSATQLASLSNSVPTTYERVTVIRRNNGYMQLIREGNPLVSATHTAYTSGYVGLLTWYTHYPSCYVDWIAVRKYASPEPAFSSAGPIEAFAISRSHGYIF